MISFFEGDRFLGNEARSLATRTPNTTILYPSMLLGREYGDPLVEARRGTRLLYDLRKDDERNTYAVNVAPNITLSPEELTGMILRYAKALAKESVQEDVRDCAITVPPYFTVRQRQALLDAARLAGFAPLGLINEGTAAATHYLSKLPLEKLPRYVMLYDMGAMDTSATLFEVKHVNETRGKFSKKSITVGVLETLAVAYDASLGGSDFDEALATHFKRAIATQRPDIDVHANGGRAWSRLVKEAQRVKEVLSANVEFTARVEGVVEGYDFKLPITRAEFEQLSEPLLARVAVPAVDALARAGIDAKQLDLFELVGGGWRVPAVQKRLQTVLARTTLDQHINSDEGAVMGAAFYGASLTTGFRVKDFKIKDAIVQAIDVNVRAQPAAADVHALAADDDELVNKSASLWKDGSRVRSKKTLTFHTTRNLTFDLSYAPETQLMPGQRRELTAFNVTGVPNRVTHANMTATPKLTASFMLDGSGIVKLLRADAHIEIVELVMPKAAKLRTPLLKKPKNETVLRPANETKKAEDEEDDTGADDDRDDDAAAADTAANATAADADEHADDARRPPDGFARVVPVDAGGDLIARSARAGVEEWLGRTLDVYEPVQYTSWLDSDGELGYFFSIRVSNHSTSTADAALRALRRAQLDVSRLNENSTVDNNATAEATLKSEQAAVLAAAALDTNDYIHVRTLYDPAGRSEKSPTIGTADEDGVAEVDEVTSHVLRSRPTRASQKPQLKVAVRGLLELKTAADVLEYFDENIVPKPKPVRRVVGVPLKIETVEYGAQGVSSERMTNYTLQLARLDAADVLKRDNADKKNTIEAYCYAMKDKLSDEAFELASTDSERDAFRTAIAEASDWLYAGGAKATTKEYVERLQALKKLGDPIETRIREAIEAPGAVASMREVAESARALLVKLPDTHDVSKDEATAALELLNKAEKWLNDTEAAQSKLQPYERPVLTVALVTEKFAAFERKLKTLSTRAKKRPGKAPTASTKPKPKPAAGADDKQRAKADAKPDDAKKSGPKFGISDNDDEEL